MQGCTMPAFPRPPLPLFAGCSAVSALFASAQSLTGTQLAVHRRGSPVHQLHEDWCRSYYKEASYLDQPNGKRCLSRWTFVVRERRRERYRALE
ncbi:CDC42 small effector protein 2 isoform X1 [Hypanus sabinus]|uniref:CDC42 small effector protein 2 isoform X1 n=1 Tax=Hypanus sabinus TaxID=79690 RepID=UPI0028C38329|nr:CDC42 small effector protein 2 isoform X1 [Hypanus sabinus]